MKKKLLTLMGVMLVLIISTVALVACVADSDTNPSMGDLVNKDGTINHDLIIGEEVTEFQWDAATALIILEKDLSFLLKHPDGQTRKVVVDGSKIMDESYGSDGHGSFMTETEFIERLDGDKAKHYYTEDGELLIAGEDIVFDSMDFFRDVMDIARENGKFSDYSYDSTLKQYTYKKPGPILNSDTKTIKFTNGKLSYMSISKGDVIISEYVLTYEDATVTLPTVA